MTEEEKQQQIEATKARLANRAVTFAAVVSTLSPTIANSQETAEKTPNTSPAPVEYSVTDIPGQTLVKDISTDEDTPSFGSPDWIRDNLKQDRDEYDQAVAETSVQITDKDKTFATEMDADMTEYLEQRQQLTETLQAPVTNDEFSGHIGNWSSLIADNYTALQTLQDDGSSPQKVDLTMSYEDFIKYKRNVPQARDIPENRHEFLSFKNKNYELVDAPKNPLEDNALAYFSAADQKIIIHNYSDKEKAENAQSSDHQSEFIKGNPFARIATLYHENTHSKHILYDGARENQKTPINAAKNDRLTETTANAVEYLAMAQQYSIMKKQGINTTATPQTETLLEVYQAYTSMPDKNNASFQEYLKEKNIVRSSNQDRQSDDNNLSAILPNAEKKLENANIIQHAGITTKDGEHDILIGISYMANSSLPISEQLKNFDIASVTINGEEISVAEVDTKYPNLKEMIADYNQVTQTYVSSLQEKPLESILEFYPGLQEALPKEGFDPNNQEHVRNIVKASSKYWHTERQDGYESQSLGAADTSGFPYHTWSEQLEILKNQDKTYAQTSEKMLSNLYIGHNVSVDLTKCRDLLDTMDNDTALKLIEKHNQTAINDNYINVTTYEEMKEIDAHLESLGLKTDADKMNYMSDFIQSAVTRDNKHQDPVLAEIMLSHNPHIGYIDGTAVSLQNGLTGQDADGNKYDLTNLTTLPQTLRTDMQQARQAYDNKLKLQIDELNHATPPQQQTQETKNQPDGPTLTPSIIAKGQHSR